MDSRIEQPALQKVAVSEELANEPDLSNFRILIAEDNDLNRELAIQLLENTNAELLIANDGNEAVDIGLLRRTDYLFGLVLAVHRGRVEIVYPLAVGVQDNLGVGVDVLRIVKPHPAEAYDRYLFARLPVRLVPHRVVSFHAGWRSSNCTNLPGRAVVTIRTTHL